MSASSVSRDYQPSYYGRPIVKEPVWKPEIPTYFFTGGLAGAAATLALGARLTGNDMLARRALWTNAAAITISPLLLIKDLGRPMRFLNMLRVFKVRSPMSVGTWIVSASGTASGVGTACELFGVLPRVKAAAETASGVLGPFLSTYTGALVADSVVPAWHGARRELPFVFAGGSCASAGGVVAALTPAHASGPARRLAIAGAALELASTKAMEDGLGELVGKPYHEGRAGSYAKAAKAATAAGGLLMAAAGRRRVGAIVAGSLLAAGAFCERFAVYHAGKQSAADPLATSIPQRSRKANNAPTSATPKTSHAT
jgi:formate-dependent nitrite reductase membrane component NrfD